MTKTNILELVSSLKQCRDISRGKALHENAIQHGLQSNKYVASALITMYSRCGIMSHAKAFFDTIPHKNVVQWTSLIQGYVENGEIHLALDLLAAMDCQPNAVTLLVALKACVILVTEMQLDKNLCMERGMDIHRQAKALELHGDIFVASALVDMYGKCGSMTRARAVFDGRTESNKVMWNALILGYVDNGEHFVALDCFSSRDCEPDSVSFIAGLKACAALALKGTVEKQFCLEKGMELHESARELGFDTDVFVENTLVDMYVKCGSMSHAQAVVAKKKCSDCVSLNILMLGYISTGETRVAWDIFTCMDCEPDPVTFVAALKALKELQRFDKEFCLERGVVVHKLAKEQRVDVDLYVGNTLVDMYSACGSMVHARETFQTLQHRNVVSWNNLMRGYVENGESVRSLGLFSTMDCQPDSVTFLAALKACWGLATRPEPFQKKFCLETGMATHKQAEQHGFTADVFVANALIDLYTRFGCMPHARSVFHTLKNRDTVSWNTLILGYVDNGRSSVALDLFTAMDCKPDSVTYVAALKACGGLVMSERFDKRFCLEKGMFLHRELAKQDSVAVDMFVENTLIDMYGKCGGMPLARTLFDAMADKDVVSWSSLILGYVENGDGLKAVEVFTSMTCQPNHVTFAAVLKACGSIGAVAVGEKIHSQIRQLDLERNHAVATCLVDFYGKCGMMEAATEVFNRMVSHDIVAWTALVAGYSLLGHTSEVFHLLKRMHEAGVQPNDITFLSIFTACSHVGCVEEARMYLELMLSYGVSPTREHYVCLIDLFGRANRLNEALLLVQSMPFQLGPVGWTSLLAACRKWNNVEIGKIAFNATMHVTCGPEKK